MTVRQSITKLRLQMPGLQYGDEVVLDWLSQVEGTILTEVHCLDPEELSPIEEISDAELTAKYPYDKLYTVWLKARAEFADGEYDRSANSMALYNAFYDEYRVWVANHLRPENGQAVQRGYYLSAYGLARLGGYEGSLEQWLEDLKGPAGGYYSPVVEQTSADSVTLRYIPSSQELPAILPVTVQLPTGGGGAVESVCGLVPDQEGDVALTGEDIPVYVDEIQYQGTVQGALRELVYGQGVWVDNVSSPAEFAAMDDGDGGYANPEGRYNHAGGSFTISQDYDTGSRVVGWADEEAAYLYRIAAPGAEPEQWLLLSTAEGSRICGQELKGEDGDPGANGLDGGYYSPVVGQSIKGYMDVDWSPSSSEMPAVQQVQVQLPQGVAGEDGIGIASIEQIETSTESGGINTIKVLLDNGVSALFYVRNGEKGEDGTDCGIKGVCGIHPDDTGNIPVTASDIPAAVDGIQYQGTVQGGMGALAYATGVWADSVSSPQAFAAAADPSDASKYANPVGRYEYTYGSFTIEQDYDTGSRIVWYAYVDTEESLGAVRVYTIAAPGAEPVEWPAGVSEDQIAAAVEQYMADHPVSFTTDETLTLNPETNVLSVNVATEPEPDNTLPITAAAVYATVGNIGVLLATI